MKPPYLFLVKITDKTRLFKLNKNNKTFYILINFYQNYIVTF